MNHRLYTRIPRVRAAAARAAVARAAVPLLALPFLSAPLVASAIPALPQESSQLAGPGAIDVDAIVAAALAVNPTVAVAEHRRAAAAATPPGLRDLPDPELRFGIYSVPLDSIDPLDGQLRLQLSQRFPHPGTLSRRAAVAVREVERLAAGVATSRAGVAARARRAYADLYFAERAALIHHGHVELVRELSESAEERYATGGVPQENVLRALQELTLLFTQLTSVERDVATAGARLNGVLHRAPDAPLGPAAAPSLDQLDGWTLASLLAAAEQVSPEIETARAASRREDARIEAARHEAKPDFGVMAEWWTASDGMGGRFERYALLGTMTLPWLHDDKYTAAVGEALATRSAAEAEVLTIRDRVFERVATAWERARAAERIAELYRTTLLPQSEQSMRAARAAYEASQADFVTVVDNERTLLLNRLGLAEIEAEYARAVADLFEAVGVIDADEVRQQVESAPDERPADAARPGRTTGSGS